MSFETSQPSRHAQPLGFTSSSDFSTSYRYGEHWGEGAARCFSLEADILDEDHAVRLMPVPDSFAQPLKT